MEQILNKMKQCIENIGIYVEDFNKDLKLKDIIFDSLAYINFFIELETLFDVEIPDSFYSNDVYDMTISDFSNKVIAPLTS